MIKTVKPVLFGFLCLALATSCKKDVVDVNQPSPEATAGAIEADTNTDYYPYKTGNSYSFVDSVGTAATAVGSTVNISGDSTIDGKTFKRSAPASGAAKFVNTDGGVTTLVSFNGADKITTTVLKANEPVGATWTDNFTNGGIPTNYEWKMIAKGLTRTVLGTTYNNVIQVHLNGTAEIPGQGKVVFADSDYFYAPNVGLIENVDFNTVTGKATMHRVLKTYSGS